MSACLPDLPEYRSAITRIMRLASANGYRLTREPVPGGQLYTLSEADGSVVAKRCYLGGIQTVLRRKGVDA